MNLEAGLNKPVNILFISLVFPPDGVSSAQLLGEIVEDLNDGTQFNARVISTSPHYNVDETAVIGQPIDWKWHQLLGKSDYKGTEVWHIRMADKASSSIMRALQWLWFHVASFVIACKVMKNVDVIAVISPPPTTAFVASILSKIYGRPFIYILWELYPQILVKLNRMKPTSYFYKFLSRLEKHTYKKADKLVCLHEPMRQAVVEALPSIETKTTVIPTFADINVLRPMNRTTSLRKQYRLEDKFVVGYAGNLGSSEDITILLEAARQLPDVSFLICGDGTERERLEKFTLKNNLANVIFTGHLPYERVPEITATADICTVVLSDGVGDEALPSKVYKIMACGRPVLAITGENTPLANLVNSLKIGTVVTDYSANSVKNKLEEMKLNETELESMAEAARTSAVEFYSRERVVEQYKSVILSLA